MTTTITSCNTETRTQNQKVRVWKYLETKEIREGQTIDESFIETINDLGEVMLPSAVSGRNAIKYLKEGLIMISQREISETQIIWVYNNPHHGNNKFAMYLELMPIEQFINSLPHKELIVQDLEEGVVEYLLYS